MENGGEPKFPAFPYKPYSIQIDFMNALYHSLDTGGVSMLESPTGTGKTLSIICSALQWVLDQRQKQKSEERVASDEKQENIGQIGSDDEPDWIKNFVVNKDNQMDDKKSKKKKYGFASAKPAKRNNKDSSKDLFSCDPGEACFNKKKECKKTVKKNDADELGGEEFLLEEYESEEEGEVGSSNSKRKASTFSVSSSSDEEGESEEEEEEVKLKVFFCSRTHSQLSQFIKELRKTVFANEMNIVSLGSRKNFCINEEVLRLGNSTRINERCLELQKSKKKEISKIKNLGAEGRIRQTKASSGCPMLRKHKLQRQFRSEISQQGALDIEDLVQLGRNIGTCPYYGSRSMITPADLVVLPYQSLLSKSSCEALGLNLKNNVVIIDEAHNLADSLISMYDAKITLPQLEKVHSHIEKYFGRFHSLLGSGNRRYIQTLLVLTRAFLRVLVDDKDVNCLNTCPDAQTGVGEKHRFDSSMAINDFLFSLNIDNINLMKVLQYIKESNIMHKVSGYGDKMTTLQKGSAVKENGESCDDGSTLSGFRALADMLLSLTNNDGDGRIIISRKRPTCSRQGAYLKYVMLTGEKIFSEIVHEAHAVVLAGGTLQPIEETRERLFPWLPSNQLHFFSCSHIVPPESILPLAVSCGPSGRSFDFSYNLRSSSTMIEELGLLLCNLATVVPEGIVVFLSSFEYEGQVYDAWKTSGILERLMKKKYVFREPRKNTKVEVILKEYKEAIDNPAPRSGAILLAVVGGKISEGINFSDGMGRCIVMVGLPYPSPSDIELLERVKHIEGLGDSSTMKSLKLLSCEEYNGGDIQAAFNILRSCTRRGKEYYENLCMKAVNQSIGRAIRHINDYAAILLVDIRYASDSSKRSFSHPSSKLPQWIKDRLVSATNNYGEVHKLLHHFFKLNKNRGCK
ncbi:RAD3-like DNA-binding helicase protein isoform 1 [Theobroma cacao]|uniref:RAD3-like DNA-binding helicase protein isoform 1 n=1 Tax=Theobroma cacao TaxID=3641 RepID=A0A061GAA1_THECC|nr:RAD3-like DNA-binding helicase protein isoform 1 [Theobroma cacao]